MIETKIDSRICVKKTEDGFKIDRQDIGLEEAREVLQRLALFIRAKDLNLIMLENGYIDSYAIHPDEPTDQSKVCIAFDPVTGKIQAAVVGMTSFQASMLLEFAAAYFNALMMQGVQ